MPRSIWSGSISFGLVNVPVRLYSAIAEHKLHFHFLHEKDDSPIGYQKVCKKEDKPVPDKEITKAFEHSKGEYVYMDEKDFEAARVRGYKSIDITDFVPADEIDPIYFAKTYFVGPQNGAEKVYSLLVKAMEESGLTAIATFVMRDQQHLGALRVRDGVITLEQLYFADEIRPVDEVKASRTRVSKDELRMAEQLIESFTGPWKPEKYEDTYRDELLAIIKAKQKGEEIHEAAEDEEEEPTDLMDALRASIERSGRKAARPRTRTGGGGLGEPEGSPGGRRSGNGASRNGGGRGLEKLSKQELEERARGAGIEGRSKMSKDELVEALREAA